MGLFLNSILDGKPFKDLVSYEFFNNLENF